MWWESAIEILLCLIASEFMGVWCCLLVALRENDLKHTLFDALAVAGSTFNQMNDGPPYVPRKHSREVLL